MSYPPYLSLHVLALAAAIILTAVSQVMLRAGAMGKGNSMVAAVFNSKTLIGYLIFLVVILLTIFAMQKIPLKSVSAFNGISYVLVPLMARLFVKDPLNTRMMIGLVMIVFGIVIFSL